MITFDDFQEVRRRVEAEATKLAEARGAAEQIRKRLKNEYGADGYDDGLALYNENIDTEHNLLTKWNKSLAAFKKEWPELFGEEK